MVKLILLYHQLEDGQFFDEDHYHKVHLATAIEFAGKYHCRKIEIGLSIEDVPERAGRPSQFHRFMELHFDNIDDLRSCVFSKEMLALNPDAVNYHNVGTSSGLFEAEEFFLRVRRQARVDRWSVDRLLQGPSRRRRSRSPRRVRSHGRASRHGVTV